jgi:hypothetical protein
MHLPASRVTPSPFGYGDMRGDWTRVLDAMIFTHDMSPSTPAAN